MSDSVSELHNVILLGDCLDRLRELPDACVDSCVTDPPYGLDTRSPTVGEIVAYLTGERLGPLKQGRQYCSNSILRSAVIPDPNDSQARPSQDLVSFQVSLPGLSMGTSGVQFDNQFSVRKEEVDHERSGFGFHDVLVNEENSPLYQSFDNGQLCLRERQGFTGCVEVCRCFTQTGESTFRVLVRLGNNPFGQPESPSDIVAGSATEVRAVLTLDVREGTGELCFADPTDFSDAGLLLTTPEGVGTSSGASRLLTYLQILLAGQVDFPADRALSFYISLPQALLDRFHQPRVAYKDFMGKPWEIPSVAVWKEVYRVLKPGGHVLTFAGTRTWDLMAMGLRAAGFEFRDTIADEFGTPVLQWCHGMGFPKSLNVSLTIDKIARGAPQGGPDPEKRGQGPAGDRIALATGGATGKAPTGLCSEYTPYSPSTPEAKQWKGFGTALKPSWEPILVFRKPLEGTVVENVLKHGTGALNIDGCRVASPSNEHFRSTVKGRTGGAVVGADEREGAALGMFEPGKSFEPVNHPGGRWPSNLVLTHHPDCKQVGTQSLKGDQRGDPGGKRPGGFANVGSDNGDDVPNARVYGNEEVPIYECADGCPVKALAKDTYGDSGSVSRFFPSFEGQRPPEAPFFYCAKAGSKETTLDGRVNNDHPTRKPVKLMQWLVRLVTPKGGLVLDPYCGSGSTLHAAVLERVDYLGIEKHEPYHEIATQRLAIVCKEEGEVNDQKDAFAAIMNGDFE